MTAADFKVFDLKDLVCDEREHVGVTGCAAELLPCQSCARPFCPPCRSHVCPGCGTIYAPVVEA